MLHDALGTSPNEIERSTTRGCEEIKKIMKREESKSMLRRQQTHRLFCRGVSIAEDFWEQRENGKQAIAFVESALFDDEKDVMDKVFAAQTRGCEKERKSTLLHCSCGPNQEIFARDERSLMLLK